MKRRTITIAQDGWIIQGEALLNLWGGGQGTIAMKETRIPCGLLSRDTILKSINDNGMGCVSMERAALNIYESYEGRLVYRTTMEFSEAHDLRFAKIGI